MQCFNLVDVETVGKNDELVLRVFATRFPPVNCDLGPFCRVAAIDPNPGPPRQPIRRVVEKALRTISVRQDDAQIAVMFFLPVSKNLIRRAAKRLIIFRQGRIDHGQFVGVCANRLNLTPHGNQTV